MRKVLLLCLISFFATSGCQSQVAVIYASNGSEDVEADIKDPEPIEVKVIKEWQPYAGITGWYYGVGYVCVVDRTGHKMRVVLLKQTDPIKIGETFNYTPAFIGTALYDSTKSQLMPKRY